jgi:hypothetical protein
MSRSSPYGCKGAARQGAAEQQPERLRIALEAMLQLLDQPALAQPGFGDQGDGVETARLQGGLERGDEPRQLGVAADQRRLGALDAAGGDAKGARLGAQHEPGPERLVLPLDLDRRLRLEVEHAAHVAPGLLADAQAARRRGLLEPGGDVDREAADRSLVVDAAAEQGRGRCGCRAAPGSRPGVALLDPRRLDPGFGEQVEAGEHGPLGVVLARRLGAEGGEQAVAGVLQDLAAARRDPAAERLQRRIHDVEHVLGVDRLAERGRARPQSRNSTEHLAPPRRRDAVRALLGEQRRERRVDDGAAENRALRLERRDGLAQGSVRRVRFGHGPDCPATAAPAATRGTTSRSRAPAASSPAARSGRCSRAECAAGSPGARARPARRDPRARPR